jgi:hypothetical protein
VWWTVLLVCIKCWHKKIQLNVSYDY